MTTVETRNFVAFDFDSLLTKLFCGLVIQQECSPRGMKVKELVAPRLELVDPRCRLIRSSTREANYGFAVGEFLWYWRGAKDLETMQYYNKRMKNFSNDGKTLNSAYGYRIRSIRNGVALDDSLIPPMRFSTQWENCIEDLFFDNDTRRAVLFIDSPYDHLVKDSKDVPCTLTLQFLLRDEQLNLHVNMRSNDAIWGLTYDLFSFTLIQECMVLELRKRGINCGLGSYIHTAGSMHIYERHYEMVDKFIVENMRADNITFAQVMEGIDSLESLDRLLCDEEALRIGKIDLIDEYKYVGACRWMAQELNMHRMKRDNEGVKNV